VHDDENDKQLTGDKNDVEMETHLFDLAMPPKYCAHISTSVFPRSVVYGNARFSP
jgi:hypothetical protein